MQPQMENQKYLKGERIPRQQQPVAMSCSETCLRVKESHDKDAGRVIESDDIEMLEDLFKECCSNQRKHCALPRLKRKVKAVVSPKLQGQVAGGGH